MAFSRLKEMQNSGSNKIKEKLTHEWKEDEYKKIYYYLELIFILEDWKIN